jgi:hypothetical protein
MLRSALAAIVLLAVLLLSSAHVGAHAIPRPSALALRDPAVLVMAPVAPTHDGSPCCPDGVHDPLCCPASVCPLVGCLAIVEAAVLPVTPEKLAYDLFEGSRPDGAGIAPDFRPPRAIV